MLVNGQQRRVSPAKGKELTLEDWLAAVDAAAHEFTRKTGDTPTWINVRDAKVARMLSERLGTIYTVTGVLNIQDNHVAVGVPSGMTGTPTYEEQEPEPEPDAYWFDESSSTLYVGQLKFLDVYEEDLPRLDENLEEAVAYFIENYDYVEMEELSGPTA